MECYNLYLVESNNHAFIVCSKDDEIIHKWTQDKLYTIHNLDQVEVMLIGEATFEQTKLAMSEPCDVFVILYK